MDGEEARIQVTFYVFTFFMLPLMLPFLYKCTLFQMIQSDRQIQAKQRRQQENTKRTACKIPVFILRATENQKEKTGKCKNTQNSFISICIFFSICLFRHKNSFFFSYFTAEERTHQDIINRKN